MSADKVAAGGVPEGAKMASVIGTYEQFIAKNREMSVMATAELWARSTIVFADSTSSETAAIAAGLETLAREWTGFEYAIAATEKDPKLAAFAKEGKRNGPMALIIEQGVVKTVVKADVAKTFLTPFPKWREGGRAVDVFPEYYGETYHLRIGDIFGFQKPDYAIASMREWIEMWMRLQFESIAFPTQIAFVLFYDETTEKQLGVKAKWDQLRKASPEVDYPAVKVDNDSALREWATSQKRGLPVVLAMRDGEVVNVGRPTDLSRYCAEMEKWVSGTWHTEAFTSYNGDPFRMRVRDMYINNRGTREVSTMPWVIAMMENLMQDGSKFPDSKAMILAYTPKQAKDSIVSEWTAELQKKYPTIDFLSILGDKSIDGHVYEMVTSQGSELPVALVVERGTTKAVTPVSQDITSLTQSIDSWIKGTAPAATFTPAGAVSIKTPKLLKAGKPTHIHECHTVAGFVKLIRKLQDQTAASLDVFAGIIIYERGTPQAKEIIGSLDAITDVKGNMEWGLCDVKDDESLRGLVSKEGTKLPCLYAIQAGRIVGMVEFQTPPKLSQYIRGWIGPKGSAKTAFPKKTQPMMKSPRKLMLKAKANGLKNEATMDTWSEFMRKAAQLHEAPSKQGRAVMILYRDSDMQLKDFAYAMSFLPLTKYGVEYLKVNISHDRKLNDWAVHTLRRGFPVQLLIDGHNMQGKPIRDLDVFCWEIKGLVAGEPLPSSVRADTITGPIALPEASELRESSKIENERGMSGFSKLFSEFTGSAPAPHSEKAIIMTYSNAGDAGDFPRKVLTNVMADWPSLRVGMVDGEGDEGVAHMAARSQLGTVWVVVFEQGDAKTCKSVEDWGDFMERMNRWQAGESASVAFSAPETAAGPVQKIHHAVYRMEAERALTTRCAALTRQAKTVMFMKGSRREPECKFSREATKILDDAGIDYVTDDILLDPLARQELKSYSDWPTFPQLYHDGEFIGGVDIIRTLADNGHLLEALD